ncbi:MAG TPA: M90 family metallopeptidase [Wenzhouxiangellaceae bacterium]|nr:M90 family metallopeptidase [Wenzhouxiangellaceae bacterium]
MIGWFRRRLLSRKADEMMPDAAEFAAICNASRCLAVLNQEERLRLRRLAAMILAGKQFHGAGGFQPGWEHCLPVAAHAALPALEIGLEAYNQFHTFILYEDEFESDIEEIDEAGVVHRGRDLRAGEAWHRGPVVLSLADVHQSGHGDGYHVVVHELAHQLDHLTGDADGYPPLPPQITHRDWVETFSAAYRRLGQQIRCGGEPSIDPYAADSPAEFFAVASEYFFDWPERLADLEPGIYRLLAMLYRQDPVLRTRNY